MSKPRIVREYRGQNHAGMLGPPKQCSGPAYLALPWPEACPYTPEQVMAACERHGRRMLGVPELDVGSSSWMLYAPLIYGIGSRWVKLTPEFMAEPQPKECPLCAAGWPYSRICPQCGATLYDRRTQGERRKGERRAPEQDGKVGRRALDSRGDAQRSDFGRRHTGRRKGLDRRRQP